MNLDLKEELRKITEDRVVFNRPLNRLTTLGVGGSAWAWVAPSSRDELMRLLDFSRTREVPYFVLGKGSNLLVSDNGYHGMVISLEKGFSDISFKRERERVSVQAGAGASLPELIKRCVLMGCGGIEFAAGIPGSIGGAVRMNAGAFGAQMQDITQWIQGMNQQGTVQRYGRSELSFSYRELMLQQGLILLKVGLELQPDTPQQVRAKVQHYLEKRGLPPGGKGKAGSIFKNPEGHYAGKLIEDAGLKGIKAGGARVSEEHANWIVTGDKAKAEDVYSIMKKIQEVVQQKFKVALEPEIILLGFNHC